MKDRDIVILVLCVLGGYLILQALNHGFSFKLDLIEGIGGTCKSANTGEELFKFDHKKPLKKRVDQNVDAEKAQGQFQHFVDKIINPQCAQKHRETDCIADFATESFLPTNPAAARFAKVLTEFNKGRIDDMHDDGKCSNDPDDGYDPCPTGFRCLDDEWSGNAYCNATLCSWIPDSQKNQKGNQEGTHATTGQSNSHKKKKNVDHDGWKCINGTCRVRRGQVDTEFDTHPGPAYAGEGACDDVGKCKLDDKANRDKICANRFPTLINSKAPTDAELNFLKEKAGAWGAGDAVLKLDNYDEIIHALSSNSRLKRPNFCKGVGG